MPLRPSKLTGAAVAFVFALALGCASLHFAAAEPAGKAMQAPGSKITMQLAPTFVPADRFVGFVDEARGISIVTSDLPARAYPEIATGMTPQALAAKGFQNARAEKLNRQGDYVYLRAVQVAGDGVPHEKFMLVVKADAATSIVSITLPKDSLDEAKAAELTRVLESVQPATAVIAPLKPAATIDDPAPLKLAVSYGLTQLWTLDGRSGAAGYVSPSIIVAGSLNRDEIANPTKLSADGLTSLAGHKNVVLGKTAQLTVDGHQALEGTAVGIDEKTGEERSLYQVVVLPKGGGYVRLIGIAPRKDEAEWFVMFRRAVRSMKLAK